MSNQDDLITKLVCPLFALFGSYSEFEQDFSDLRKDRIKNLEASARFFRTGN